MKLKFIIKTIILILTVFACERETANNQSVTLKITFLHKWNQTIVNNNDFNIFQFTNAFGNELSIERLRYLVSDVKLTKNNGETILINNYSLLNLEDNNTLSIFSDQNLNIGSYDISFVLGFKNEYNIDGAYPDLNSASWNVPPMLGGGYHFMQLDGKYINNDGNEASYNYHLIRAADNLGPSPTFPQDTFIEISLGPISILDSSEVFISMNIAKWFEDPNLWDLNFYNQMLMPNSMAQIMMYENGQNIFNIESIE
jgi:hypothetical protein